MDKHTPALQHVAVSENGELRWMTGRKPRDCELYAMPDGGRLSPLIAAAPELLESLQQVIPILDEMEYWPPGTSDAIDVARAALAKARGEA